jgi:hypothetical protein
VDKLLASFLLAAVHESYPRTRHNQANYFAVLFQLNQIIWAEEPTTDA